MAVQPEVPVTLTAEDATERKLKSADLRWKIRVAKADVLQKILVSIIGGVIAFIFYIFQANQTESRYFADVQAQRERADADLRANMFKTLFDAYFKNKLEAAQKAAESGKQTSGDTEKLLITLGQEVMLSDLLARNFETVDVRPLFEDLDRRLTDLIERGGKDQNGSSAQANAFRERERLRRVAYGATSRQVELLRANADATVQQVRIEQCQNGSSSAPTFAPNELPMLPGSTRGIIKGVEDGSVTITLRVPSTDVPVAGNASPDSSNNDVVSPPRREVPLTVTYFDMPTLENVRLPDRSRLAITLTRSGSTQSCQRFSPWMDKTTQEDCKAHLETAPTNVGACSWAVLSITVIPKDYIGMRDRPYLSELSRYGSRLDDWLSNLLPSDRHVSGPE